MKNHYRICACVAFLVVTVVVFQLNGFPRDDLPFASWNWLWWAVMAVEGEWYMSADS